MGPYSFDCVILKAPSPSRALDAASPLYRRALCARQGARSSSPEWSLQGDSFKALLLGNGEDDVPKSRDQTRKYRYTGFSIIFLT